MIVILLYCMGVFSVASQAYSIVINGDKQGLSDVSGNMVIPASYDQLGWSDGSTQPFGNLIGYREGRKWGLISIQNKVVVDPTYYRLERLNEKYIKASIKGAFSNLLFNGLINQQGKVVLSCNYFDILTLSESFIVSNYNKGSILKGVYNAKFEVVAPVSYEKIEALDMSTFACQKNDGKWHFYNLKGDQETLGFDEYKLVQDQILVKRKGQYGTLDLEHLSEKIPIVYKRINSDGQLIPFPSWEVYSIQLDTLEVFRGDSVGIVGDMFITNINGNQQVMIETRQLFEDEEVELKYASNGFLIVKQLHSKKWKLLTTQGNTIIDDQDSIKFDGVYFSASKNQKWQVFNRFGRKLSIKTFDEVGESISNLLPVKRLDYWALMDFQGNLLSSPKYDSILGGRENRIIVDYLGSKGVIDAFGEWVLRPSFDNIIILSETIVASKKRVHTIFDHTGRQKFTFQSDGLEVRDSYIAILQESQWGMISLKGTYIADPIYHEVGHIGHLLFGKANQYVSLFYADGQQLTDANDRISDITGVNEDLYRVIIDGKTGYIDVSARLRIANRYDEGGLLFEDRLPVKLLGRWGYVNKYEQLVIQPVYDSAGNFDRQVAIVKQEEKYGLIDINGKELLSIEYEEILHHQGGGYIYKSETGYWGAANQQGQVILTPNYQMIKEASNGLLIVNRNGKWGIIDSNGFTKVPFQYDEIKQFQDYFLMKKLAK